MYQEVHKEASQQREEKGYEKKANDGEIVPYRMENCAGIIFYQAPSSGIKVGMKKREVEEVHHTDYKEGYEDKCSEHYPQKTDKTGCKTFFGEGIDKRKKKKREEEGCHDFRIEPCTHGKST